MAIGSIYLGLVKPENTISFRLSSEHRSLDQFREPATGKKRNLCPIFIYFTLAGAPFAALKHTIKPALRFRRKLHYVMSCTSRATSFDPANLIYNARI